MNGYKKIIRSAKVRHAILSFLSFVPDKLMIKLQYRIKMGKRLNLSNPQTYTEKLQWYKLYYHNPLMTKCADKHLVREYLTAKGYADLSCKEYGVYDRPEDICFDDLPEKFVIKTTNGSGTNIICKDKSHFSRDKAIADIKDWLKRDCYGLGREWAYKDIAPRIIVEEFLEDAENKYDGINDYKFMCFSGKACYVVFDADRYVAHKRSIYDADWNYIDVGTDCEKLGDVVPKPKGFEEMKKIAEDLSKDFPCVRVDLYWVNHRAYFGEMTFYPWTGYIKFEPDEFDMILGDKFVLPEKYDDGIITQLRGKHLKKKH